MKRILLSLCLILCLLVPCVSLAVPVSAEEDADETAPAVTYIPDTVLISETDSFSSPASTAVTGRWNKSHPAAYGGTTDPLDPENKVGFCRIAQGTSNASYMLQKYFLDATLPYVVAFNVLLPGEDQADIANAPTSFKGTLFGSDQFSLTQSGSSYSVLLPDGTAGTLAAGTWARFFMYFSPETSETVVTIRGSLTDAGGVACDALQASGIANAAANNNFIITYGVPAQTGDTALTYGFFLDNVYMCQPGDFYLVDASLEPYADDSRNNLKLDGVFTMTFSHDIDVSDFDLSQIRVYDENGNPVSYTAVSCGINSPDRICLDFSRNPLSKYTTYTVALNGMLQDCCGSGLMGDPFVTFSTLGAAGDVRPKNPVQTLPANGLIMPDVYNTGYQCAQEDLVPLTQKYPNLTVSGSIVTITDAVAAEYGYSFSGFTYTGTIRVTCSHPVTMENFYLCGDSYYALQNLGGGHLTVSYMEGTGSKSAFVSGANLTLSHCYIHDVAADHMKAGANQRVEYCYFVAGGAQNPSAHADCIQFSGSTSSIVDNIVIYGCRFDIPSLLYDYAANAALFFKPEAGTMGYSNVQFVGNWINGGGYSTYLNAAGCGADQCFYITFSDNQFGYGHRFGKYLTFNGWASEEDLSLTGGEYSRNGYVTGLSAGSVLFFDGEGNRVADLSQVTSGSVTVSVNMANYLLNPRNYRLEAQVFDSDGNLLTTKTVSGTIAGYIPYSQYATEDNIYSYTDAAGNTYERLVTLPDEPVNVLCDLTLENLGEDLSGCTLEIVAYDVTEGETWLRSAILTGQVADNTITDLTQSHQVTVLGKDGDVIAILSVLDGFDAILPAAPEIPDYVFSCWEGNPEHITADTTIRAVYTPTHYYQVTFLDRDGAVIDVVEVAPQEGAVAPTPPQVDGCVFKGWSQAFDCVTSDITVQAQYESAVVVTFDSAGGSAVADKVGLAGTALRAPTAPTRYGYRFDGWYLGEEAYTFSTFPEEGITLTAHWSVDASLFADAYQALQNARTPEEQFAAIRTAQTVLAIWDGDITLLPEAYAAAYAEVLASYNERVARSSAALTEAEKTGDAWIWGGIVLTSGALAAAFILGKRRFF